MPTTSALRFRHAHTLPVSGLTLDLHAGFTLEAWVQVAPMDSAARIYAEPGYQGKPVCLKIGATLSLPRDRLPQVGSVDLPEGVEAVFFSEEHCRGQAISLRDDCPVASETLQAARSLVLIDRLRRKQDCVVVFDGQYGGNARLLRVGERITLPEGAFFGGSLWIPPGVAVELSGRLSGLSNQPELVTLHGDRPLLPLGYRCLSARRESPTTGEQLLITSGGEIPRSVPAPGASWGTEVQSFSGLRIPDKMVLWVEWETQGLSGHSLLVGDHTDLQRLPCPPHRAHLIAAPDGPEGVAFLGDADRPGRLLGTGTYPTPTEAASAVCIPNGYRMRVKTETGMETWGPGYQERSPSGAFVIEKYVGVLTGPSGFGLSLDRVSGTLRGGGDTIQLGDGRLRNDAWHHIALRWDGTHLDSFLDGKRAKREPSPPRPEELSGAWSLADGLRGALFQVRAWNGPREDVQIRDQRYLDQATEPGAIDLLAPHLDTAGATEDLCVVETTLPGAPQGSSLYRSIHSQMAAGHETEMKAARVEAALLEKRARERANAQIFAARDEARRKVHFSGLKSVAFVRGNDIIRANWNVADVAFRSERLELETEWSVPLDTAWGIGEANTPDTEWLYVACAWPSPSIYRRNARTTAVLVQDLPAAPITLAVDGIGSLDDGEQDGIANETLFWIDTGGLLYRLKLGPAGAMGHQLLHPRPLPHGRPRAWDLAVDTTTKRLIWSNGWEIYTAKLTPRGENGLQLDEVQILISHAASPFPVAVAADPDGSIYWVDIELGRVRKWQNGQIEDLYAAPNPARSLGFGLIQSKAGEAEAHYVYWSAFREHTIEVPVLDTPGRYIDLAYTRNSPYGQRVRTVVVDQAVGTRWQEMRHVLRAYDFDNNRIQTFGLPLSTSTDSFTVDALCCVLDNPWEPGDRATSYAWNPPYPEPAFLSLRSPTLNLSCPVLRPTETGEYGNPAGPHCVYLPDFPRGVWRKVRWTVARETRAGTAGWTITVSVDGVPVGERWHPGGDQIASPPQWELVGPERQYMRTRTLEVHVAEVRISGPKPLRLAGPTLEREARVSYGPQADGRILIPATSWPDAAPSTTLLRFESPVDALVLEPVRLDLGQGWTASAELIWDGPQTGGTSQTLYELCTDEDEERLVCAIDASGKPYLRIRWGGRLRPWTETTDSGARLRPGRVGRLTWTLGPTGLVNTFVDGALSSSGQIRLQAGPLVFTGHRIGAPNPQQAHTGVRGALIQDNDAIIKYTGFVGWIARFAVWNQLAPQAAEGIDHGPPADPSWDRSLVTVTSRQRYLHAGRVDRSEPALPLFPIDLDGGLALETDLHSAHARLTAAHAQVQAAEVHASALREAALTAARTAAADAERELAAAQAQAAADLAKANEQAKAQRAAEDQRREEARLRAEADRAAGAGRAAETRNAGASQARDQEIRAAADKQARVAEAQRRLSDHRIERDQKRAEYDRR